MTISDQPGLFGDIGSFSPWHQEEMDWNAENFVLVENPDRTRRALVELRVSRPIVGGLSWDYCLHGRNWGCEGPWSAPVQAVGQAHADALAFLGTQLSQFTEEEQATIRAATGRHVLTGDGAAWPWVVI